MPLAEGLEDRRLFSAGALDPSFSGDGLASTSPAGGFDVVALDHRNGRTVVLGESTGTAAGGVVPDGGNVVAYNAAGNLDTTFSGDGVRPIPRVTLPSDLFIQPDGKILVAGRVDGVPGVARVLANGGADTSFGNGDGFVSLPQLDNVATAVRVAPDGKVVVAGQVSNAAGFGQLAVVRLTAAGKIDTSFSGDGLATAWTGSAGATGLAVQPDGKVVVAGTIDGQNPLDPSPDVGAARFTASGALDATFATGGLYSFDGGGEDRGGGIDLTPDGHVLLTVIVRQSDAGIVRLTSAGVADLDLTAIDIVTRAGASTLRSAAARSSPDGSQYYLFASPAFTSGSGETTTIGRYDADGTRDFTFGTNGAVVSPGERVGDLTSDGKLVTAGNPILAGSEAGYDPAVLQVRRRITAAADADRVRTSDGKLTVEGTAGNDTITLSTAGGTLTVKLNGATRTFSAAAITSIEVTGNGGDDTINTSATAAAVHVFGGAGADKITTGGGADTADGGDGNDTVNTGGGNDLAYGGAGDDLLNGAAGADTFYGDGGVRGLTYDIGKDRVYGGDGNDLIVGGSNSLLTYDPDHQIADYLDGGAGDDTAVVGQGDATYSVEHTKLFL